MTMWLANKFPSVKRLLKENAELRAELDLARLRNTPIPDPPQWLVDMVEERDNQPPVVYDEATLRRMIQDAEPEKPRAPDRTVGMLVIVLVAIAWIVILRMTGFFPTAF